MSAWLRGACGLVILIVPAAARGHGLYRPVAVAAYYYPVVPVTWVPAYRPVVVIPVAPLPVCPPEVAAVPATTVVPALPAVPPGRPSALPSPAPPSEPPLLPGAGETTSREPPRISESHSFPENAVATRPAARKPDGDPCWVGFWNLSGQAKILKVDGRSHSLAPGKNLTLRVNRQFIWQVNGSEPLQERVPENRATLALVIRR